MGAPGSGVDITASTIFSRLDVPVEITGFNAYEALDKLRLGEIAGAFFIGGKPMPLLREIGQGQGLRLLSIPFVQYADSYRPATISREDYPQLMAASNGEEVSTLAVRTALFTYAWRPGTTRYDALGEFSRALFTHMPKLHQAGHHPKWREIDPTSEIATLNRFEPARLWIQENGDAARRIAAEGRALLEQSDRSQSAPLVIQDQDPGPGQDQDPQTPPSSLGAALAPKATPQPKLDQTPVHGGADEARPAPAEESVIETVEPVVDAEPPLSAANGPSADRIEEPGPRGGPLTPLLARERTAEPDRGSQRIPATSSARTPTF
jgi:hypothetical protein